MEKDQADKVAQAILAPYTQDIEKRKRERTIEFNRREKRRNMASFAVFGLCTGQVVTYFTNQNTGLGAVLGVTIGLVVGRLVFGLRGKNLSI